MNPQWIISPIKCRVCLFGKCNIYPPGSHRRLPETGWLRTKEMKQTLDNVLPNCTYVPTMAMQLAAVPTINRQLRFLALGFEITRRGRCVHRRGGRDGQQTSRPGQVAMYAKGHAGPGEAAGAVGTSHNAGPRGRLGNQHAGSSHGRHFDI